MTEEAAEKPFVRIDLPASSYAITSRDSGLPVILPDAERGNSILRFANTQNG